MIAKLFKKKKNPYQKALERMEKETARAIAHVHNLEKLYKKIKNKT